MQMIIIRNIGIDRDAAANVPGLATFEVKPWDMREFSIADPHGNLLRSGRASQEIAEG